MINRRIKDKNLADVQAEALWIGNKFERANDEFSWRSIVDSFNIFNIFSAKCALGDEQGCTRYRLHLAGGEMLVLATQYVDLMLGTKLEILRLAGENRGNTSSYMNAADHLEGTLLEAWPLLRDYEREWFVYRTGPSTFANYTLTADRSRVYLTLPKDIYLGNATMTGPGCDLAVLSERYTTLPRAERLLKQCYDEYVEGKVKKEALALKAQVNAIGQAIASTVFHSARGAIKCNKNSVPAGQRECKGLAERYLDDMDQKPATASVFQTSSRGMPPGCSVATINSFRIIWNSDRAGNNNGNYHMVCKPFGKR